MSGAAPRLNPLATGDTQLAHTLVPGQMVDIAGGRVMEVVDVPDRLLAPLLGEGGATLEEIRRVSGASIEMIEMVKLKLGDAERRAIVTGVRTIVAHAVKMIADVLANPTVMVAQPVQATVETRVIEIPFNKAGLIIGRAGETICDIMSKSGAHVQVSREATGEDEETRTVTIQGTAEQIESAAAHVNSKLNPDDWQLAVKAQNAMRAGFSGPLPAPASLPMHSVGAAPPPPPGRAPAPSAAAAAADPKVRETALRSLAAMARAILGDDGRETRKADAKADAKAHGTNAGAGGADGKSEEGAGEAGEEGEGEGEGESEAVLAELQLSMSVGGVMSLLDDGPVAQLQASGVELHLAKLPSRGQRAVKLSGEATAVETVAAFLRACDARAARRQKRRRPLAPQDAARRYYDRSRGLEAEHCAFLYSNSTLERTTNPRESAGVRRTHCSPCVRAMLRIHGTEGPSSRPDLGVSHDAGSRTGRRSGSGTSRTPRLSASSRGRHTTASRPPPPRSSSARRRRCRLCGAPRRRAAAAAARVAGPRRRPQRRGRRRCRRPSRSREGARRSTHCRRAGRRG